ncbi:hypothetical protein [Halorubrum amylolyticum]|uniref:hypothetical protein n=1 Tax=Halorubrum amylolyticum TaxID=2508724 RepID=UPI00100905FB|nr:hypothetical protein [Halorubrum amylolyticum]
MTGRAGRYLLASLCCAALLAVVATGGAAAVGPGEYCEELGENGSAVVGGVGDATYTDDDVTLYPGSTLTVAYCENGEPADRDWLTDGDGYETGERDGHTYPVTITGEGETGTVDFADHLAEEESPPEDRFVVTVAGGGAEAADDDITVAADDAELQDEYDAYRAAAGRTANATAALNETTNALEAGEDDLDAANETVHSLEENYTDMRDARGDLLDGLRSTGERGNVTGAVGAAAALDEEYRQRDANVTAAANAYRDAVGATAEEPRSTVQLSAFGSLGAGVALGLVAGAAVPLVAARRVKEKMKLSRDVSYDRKTALLPILLGIVAAVAGAAILGVRVGLDPILRVIA